MNDFELLTSKENLGFYKCCEVTEIFLFDKNLNNYFNLYTLITFEEKDVKKEDLKEKHPSKLINLQFYENDSYNKNYRLGIKQYYLTLEQIQENYKNLK